MSESAKSSNADDATCKSPIVDLVGESCERGGTILDEKAMIQRQKFPIGPDELIRKAKYVLKKDTGVLEPTLWADDFEFCAPIVGPLGKEEFLTAAGSFDVYKAFPDFDNRYFGFTVDPLEPGRVWFFVRLVGTNTGGLFGRAPNNRVAELPPQVFSMKFNEEGKVKELTVGYSVDRRQGNTGGLGGLFGLFYGVGQGLPFPEGRPYRLSWQYRILNAIGTWAQRFTSKKDE